MKNSKFIAIKTIITVSILVVGFSIFGFSAEKTHEAEKQTLSLVWIADGQAGKQGEYIFTINNALGFKTIEGLKKYILGLPKGTTLTWAPGCERMGDEPLLSSEKDLTEFKSFCKTNNINLVIIPAG